MLRSDRRRRRTCLRRSRSLAGAVVTMGNVTNGVWSGFLPLTTHQNLFNHNRHRSPRFELAVCVIELEADAALLCAGVERMSPQGHLPVGDAMLADNLLGRDRPLANVLAARRHGERVGST